MSKRIKNKLWLLCLAIGLLRVIPSVAAGITYYVDGRNGNDRNSGTRADAAWRSLDKAGSIIFRPGDRLLLKRGQAFPGSLDLHGSGSSRYPVQLGAFGTGRRPVIAAGADGYAVKIIDGQYWEISNIEATGAEKAGIFIGCSKDSLVLNHFRIINCYVHQVGNDSLYDWAYSTLTGGIVVANGNITGVKKNIFDHSVINDVIIDGCTVEYIKRWTCISISSGVNAQGKGNASYIRNCTTRYSVADGIRMNGVQNSFIESCVMYKNGAWPHQHNEGWGGLGAWFFNADHCTIQYCEAAYIENSHNDGGAFDIDYDQRNSTVQYCYGHDCHGYGVSVFGADAGNPTARSVVRYNIFANNARDTAYAYQGDMYVFTWNGGLLDGVKIYNNTSYWNPSAPAAALKLDATFTGSNPNLFKNNIIYSTHPWLVAARNDSLQCDHNLYWVAGDKEPLWTRGKNEYHSLSSWQEVAGQDKHSRYADPLLEDPSYHDDGMPVAAFHPKAGSPAVDAGTAVGDMGRRDFFDDPVPQHGLYDIGAAEAGFPQKDTGTVIRAGEKAPDFTLHTLNGRSVQLSSYRGSIVLMAFISLQDVPATGDTPGMRAQLTFIKSMQQQYADKGLKIILVDETAGNRGKNKKINCLYDNGLDAMPLLEDDPSGKVAQQYGVQALPAMFLIARGGTVSHVWKHTALTSQLAFAIEEQMQQPYSQLQEGSMRKILLSSNR